MLLRNLSFPAAVVKVVLLSVHLSTALVVRFGIAISNGHKQKTLLPEFPAALNTFKFKTQNALAQTENVSYLVQKHRYIHVAEKPVFSSCSCQSCPVVCPLVNCAGCAVRHFNQQWAQAKDTLARVSRGIEHIQVQDAECSSTNRKCIISSSKAPLHTCC